MTLCVLSAVIGCAVFVPQVICQEDQKHFEFHTPSANISFAADSILRQDPEMPLPKHYASLVQLRGNVQIRSCCVQSPFSNKSKISPKQVVTMRADEADFNQETGEMEVRGNVRVNFRNYPK
jgi:lipopolysaccharide assembly outer membrane protein LptD (OstA)